MVVFALGAANFDASVLTKVIGRFLTHKTYPSPFSFGLWLFEFFLNFAYSIIYNQSDVIFSLNSLFFAFYEFWHLLWYNFFIKQLKKWI